MQLSDDFEYEYKFGGGLDPDASSYVSRQADEALYQHLKAGEFCYIFNGRQMGKSSLLAQTMKRLKAEQFACAAIDLSPSGGSHTTPEAWYLGFIEELNFRFDINIEAENWLERYEKLPPEQQLIHYLEEILLVQVPGEKIVIFVDEIDSVLNLSFDHSAFFALIRACYNKRANYSIYNRLVFALFGVATPSSLIQNKKQTPFNIGRAIALNGFKFEEAKVLTNGLTSWMSNSYEMLEEILSWTGGQPFLTQKLCKLVQDSIRNPSQLDLINQNEAVWLAQLVKSRVIANWKLQDDPPHLTTIENYILDRNKKRAICLLGLYQQILQKPIAVDDSDDQIELCLSGLVVRGNNELRVYNRIYKEVFNKRWVANLLKDLRPQAYSIALDAWVASKRQDKSFLLRGQSLQEALIWKRDKILSDLDHDFIAASQELERQDIQLELEAAQQTLEAVNLEARQARYRADEANSEVDKARLNVSKARRRVARLTFIIFMLIAIAVFLVGGFAHWQIQAVAQANQKVSNANQQVEGANQKVRRANQQLTVLQKRTQALQQQADQAKETQRQAMIAVERAQYEQQQAKIAREQAGRRVEVARREVASARTEVETARKEANERREITRLEQESLNALQIFNSEEIKALMLAIKSGKELRNRLRDGLSLEKYSSTNLLLALQSILGNIQERNQFQGIVDYVFDVNFSPDGQHFVTAEEDGTIRLWDLTGKSKVLDEGHGQVWNISFSPNQNLFATVGEDGYVRLWNFSGELVHAPWLADSGGCHSLIFTPDGQRLITAGASYNSGIRKFRIWDLLGNNLGEFNSTRWDSVLSMSITQDGQHLLASGFGSSVELWNLSSRTRELVVEHPTGWVPSVSFTANEQEFITAGRYGDIRFWDRSGKLIKSFYNPSLVSSMRLSPHGNRIAVAGFDGVVRIWTLAGKQLTQLSHQGIVDSVSFSPDGRNLIAVGERGIVKLWNLSKNLVTELEVAENNGEALVSGFSPDGQHLATAVDGQAQLWEVSGRRISEWWADRNGWFVSSLSFSPDNQLLATASNRFGTIRLWRVESALRSKNRQSPSLLKEWSTEQLNYINDMSFSPDDYLAVASNDGQAKIWNIKPTTQSQGRQDPVLLRSLKGHQGPVLSIKFSPSGQIIATGGADGTVRFWNLNGEQLGSFNNSGAVAGVQFSPNGQLVVAGGVDGKVRIWNLQTRQLAEYGNYAGSITNVSFSPDGLQVATSGKDGVVKIWNLEGQQLTQFKTYQRSIRSLNFLSDGQLATTGTNGTVRFWKLGQVETIDNLLGLSCDWLKDYLTIHSDAQTRNICGNR
jgi:WD40 repeat protein